LRIFPPCGDGGRCGGCGGGAEAGRERGPTALGGSEAGDERDCSETVAGRY